jgi:1-aminocyclopropane-1-carboxylate deaminase
MVKVIAERTAELVGLRQAIRDADITFNEDYAFPEYGVPSLETLDAIRLCAQLEGMFTDPVYEGKSMQALIDMTANGSFEPGSKVLYVHLGGVPALSGYSSCFK